MTININTNLQLYYGMVGTILPKMGNHPKASLGVVFGMAQICGLGLEHPAALQGYI
jgi:hypothetical protein